MVDKANGKFGKNRPFMVICKVILRLTSFTLFHVTHLLPEGPIRLVFFVIMSAVGFADHNSMESNPSPWSCISALHS